MANDGKKSAKAAPVADINIAEDTHPDFIAGIVTDGGDGLGEAGLYDELTPIPGGGPLPPIPPFPLPRPTPIPGPFPRPGLPFPGPAPVPGPLVPVPAFCGAVSGRYSLTPTLARPPRPWPIVPRPLPIPGPIVPFNLVRLTVRVDVDRFFPQQRISIEAKRTFPQATAHVIAEVTSDVCSLFNRRTVTANITYRDGNASLIPGDTITFTARRTTGFGYGAYDLKLKNGAITLRSYALRFDSKYFDPVEFEVDTVSNAGPVVSNYNTSAHANRPADLPAETLNMQKVFQRAGFDATMSPNGGTIPTAGAGANGTWSDAEMHNAMITHWSRFANNPKWAMWVLYAARHDIGQSLGGIMFDDIGPNHRQGTAIFTDSFIANPPAGETDPSDWADRMQFWTAIHEMGHGFNLAHSWQKSLGAPWLPLANEPEARSFMNYPYNVAGGESAFFSDFRFRFSDDELIFMRHAPRRFVQMGNSDWFDNHGFEAPDALMGEGHWALEVRPNRADTGYRFLEPVRMEMKLTNTSGQMVHIDPDMLEDGKHMTVFIQRNDGPLRKWRPLMTRCHAPHTEQVTAGESVYGNHSISTGTDGWVIDEPGFYKVQVAVDMTDEIVVSNVMRIYVAPPASQAENQLAPDYFTEDVGRYLAFSGAPELGGAADVLNRLVDACPDNPAARHAKMALSNPMLRDFKVLETKKDDEVEVRAIGAKVSTAAKIQAEALLSKPDAAADTIGHIPYFGQLRQVAEAMEADGDEKGAVKMMTETIKVMKDRKILPSVIDNAEKRLKRRT